MAENPFRILLDFRKLNFKFYKFVWMSISPRELVSIKDLKEAILKKFSFERADLLLFLRDGLLPEDENISNILRENDSVRLSYAEPSIANLDDSKTINYEGDEESSHNQEKSPKKRKDHPDISEDNNRQVDCNKKRKHSFSNGTYLFKNNAENSDLITAVTDDTENIVSTVDLYNLENGKRKSCIIKKKLKFTQDVSQNSSVSENEISLSSDIAPISEKNQVKVNFCKKKKKHKHSKDLSENEIILHNDSVGMSEVNGSDPGSRKKKKKKHSKDVSENEIIFDYDSIIMPEVNESDLGSHKKKRNQSCDQSELASVSKSAVSFCDETNSTAEKSNDLNEISELRESIFQTVTDDSEILKVAPVTFCASSVSSSSGIGHSLKASEESYQKISSEQNCSSYISDGKSILETEDDNLSVGQGNSCKKRKRKRHRKRKPESISSEVDISNNCEWEVPQKMGKDSISTSTSVQTENKKTLNSPKSSALYSNTNTFVLTKSNFKEPFGTFLPSTSTPFMSTHAMSCASPKKNVISDLPGSSNSSQSCMVSTPLNAILPIVKKKTHENSPSTCSSASSFTKNNNNTTVVNKNLHKEKPMKMNDSDKATNSFSDKGIKSQFLDPSVFYKSCPPLNSCPLAGTHIAYKILELDASYSPAVSNYKEGIVKAVNSQTDQLEIELIEPEVKEGRIGKFENLYNDELPSCEVIQKVTVSWTSLIDPVQVVY